MYYKLFHNPSKPFKRNTHTPRLTPGSGIHNDLNFSADDVKITYMSLVMKRCCFWNLLWIQR